MLFLFLRVELFLILDYCFIDLVVVVTVTTTTESVKALELLTENKDLFDLVICDVNMPEMDGFKLLKQVGQLGMDLPFISKFIGSSRVHS